MSMETRTAYKITKWAKYNAALVNRYDITFWFTDDLLSQWKHDNENQGQGRPLTYSDLAIETLLTMRELFQLPYRGTEGFGRWPIEKPAHRKPKSRIAYQVQNTQSLHKTRVAKLFFKLNFRKQRL